MQNCIRIQVLIIRDINTSFQLWLSLALTTPANIYLFKVNNRNTRERCEICLKLTIKTPERRFTPFSTVSIVDFDEQVNVSLYSSGEEKKKGDNQMAYVNCKVSVIM